MYHDGTDAIQPQPQTSNGRGVSPAHSSRMGRARAATNITGLENLEPRLLLSASAFDSEQPLATVHGDGAGTYAHDDIHGFEFPDDDYGNDAANAEQAFLDTTLFGGIDFVGDHDWFSFQGEAGVTYTFTSEIFSLTDSQLVLYDTDGETPLAFDDDSGAGLAAKLVWTAPADQTYYLAVRAFDVLTGSYSITFEDDTVPTGEIRGTKWLDLNKDGVRDADEPGLQGWFIFVDSNNNRKREVGEKFDITDANGDYAITGLRPGTYIVAEKVKPGWEQTFPTEEGMEALIGNTVAGIGIDGTLVHSSVVQAYGADAGGLLANANGDVGEFNISNGWPQPGGRGSTLTITYSYSNLLDGNLGGSISAGEIIAGIEEALALWATYAPLKFVKVSDSGPMPDDLDSSYSAADHPLIRFGHHEFDGLLGTLAHGYYPNTTGLAGDIHFDNEEFWTYGPSPFGTDFVEVAVHEIGHALGIQHEFEKEAIMNPFYDGHYIEGPGTAFLFQDDIKAVQALYGELNSLTGAWTVTIASRGDIVEDIDFGNFLNDDFGDGIDGATPIDVNDTVIGIIESYGDLDWFSFDGVRGVHYNFGAYLDGLEDTVLTVYDQDGVKVVSFDDDGGPGLASFTSWIAPVSGTYYIEIGGFGNGLGGYQMQVTGLAGDLNNDGFVGIADLTRVLSNWNKQVAAGDLLVGDPTFDGFVGIEDLNMVLGNWNAQIPDPPVTGQSVTSPALVESSSVSTQTVTAPVVAVTTQPQAGVQVQQAQSVDQPQRQRRAAIGQRSASAQQPQQSNISQASRNALAAWSRGSSRSAFVSQAAGKHVGGLVPSDESQAPLGLWDTPEAG